MPRFAITELWIYPVKSLGGMRVPRAAVTPAGSFAGDREWLVVRPDGSMLWQGDLPRMTLLSTTLAGDVLTITRPDGAAITVSANHDGQPLIVTQYGHSLAGVDAGDASAAWLSDWLGAPCRLVHLGTAAHQWSGLNPIHVISEHSLRLLNQRLLEQGDIAMELERFRPNVVVAGDHAPFDEETTPMLNFGLAQILLNEPCIRCELPNISRVDASREKQPLKLIGKMARDRPSSKPASFGTYARARGSELIEGMTAD